MKMRVYRLERLKPVTCDDCQESRAVVLLDNFNNILGYYCQPHGNKALDTFRRTQDAAFQLR